jgi:membrane protein YdbS with pleckstrin-like domain
MLANDAAMSTRPVFVAWNVLATRFSLWAYCAAVVGAAGTFLVSIIYRIDAGLPGFVAFSAIGFMVAPLGIAAAVKLNYARTEYRFYPDRLEYEQGFFVVRKKTIMFRDMKEVTLRQGVSQRKCGLGTIDISTQALDVDAPSPQAARFGFTPGATSGASVQDIPDPDRTFDRIKGMVDACRR